MKESRLECLRLISCEQDVQVNTDDIINRFAPNSKQLKQLLS